MRGLFVTGTDTGVGKTEVACAILANARAGGLDVVGMKPAQSGHDPEGLSDAERLWQASDRIEPLAAVCPYTFFAPLAPAVAARLEGRTVDLESIVRSARELAERHAAILVEGAGGLLTPLTERHTYADLAVVLGLPVLVVARAGLGTVSHTALTIEALLRRGLSVSGVVLNRTAPGDDPSVAYNPGEIARLTGCEPAAVLSYSPDIATRSARMRSELTGKIHL